MKSSSSLTNSIAIEHSQHPEVHVNGMPLIICAISRRRHDSVYRNHNHYRRSLVCLQSSSSPRLMVITLISWNQITNDRDITNYLITLQNDQKSTMLSIPCILLSDWPSENLANGKQSLSISSFTYYVYLTDIVYQVRVKSFRRKKYFRSRSIKYVPVSKFVNLFSIVNKYFRFAEDLSRLTRIVVSSRAIINNNIIATTNDCVGNSLGFRHYYDSSQLADNCNLFGFVERKLEIDGDGGRH